MKKRIFILVVILVMLVAASAGASSISNGLNDKIQANYISNSANKDIVEKTLDENYIDVQYMAKEILSIDSFESENYNTYEVLTLKTDVALFEEYSKYGSLYSVLSGNSYWEVPLVDSSENIVIPCSIGKMPMYNDLIEKGYEYDSETENRLKETQGQWKVIKVGSSIPVEWISVISNVENTASLLESKKELGDIEEIKIVKIHSSTQTYLLFIKDENNEYGIPFSYNEAFTGLENGKLYTISDIMQQLYSNESIGGYGGLSVINSMSKIDIRSIVVVLIAVIMLSIVLYRKKTKKQQTKHKIIGE